MTIFVKYVRNTLISVIFQFKKKKIKIKLEKKGGGRRGTTPIFYYFLIKKYTGHRYYKHISTKLNRSLIL
jgi:hypothetical protein